MPLPVGQELEDHIDSLFDRTQLDTASSADAGLVHAHAAQLQALVSRRLALALERSTAAQDRHAAYLSQLTFALLIFAAVTSTALAAVTLALGREAGWW
jgi:hypothetical protein